MNQLPLRNVISLGCPCQASLTGLGITRDQVIAFFVGPTKYVRNTKPTNIYPQPGAAAIKTIAPNENMGRVTGINQAGTWGQLDSTYWIFLEDSMYTVNLTTPPPNSILDAVGREVKDLSVNTLDLIAPYLFKIGLGIGLVYGVILVGKAVITRKANKIAAAV